MNSEQEKDLINYLASLGFTGDGLISDLRGKSAGNAASFTLNHKITFDDDQVSFDLRFRRDPQFNSYRLEEYEASYLPKIQTGNSMARTFLPHEDGMCNVNLAYHIVSGRLDNLYEQLAQSDVNSYPPGKDLYIELEKTLSENPDEFILRFSRNEPDGLVEFQFSASKVQGWYYPDDYIATLIPYPAIEHGTFNGIDTQKLEEEMRSIDWHNDRKVFLFHENAEPEFRPKVADIQDQIYRLSLDWIGAEIADKLQLKYWTDATFFEGVIQQTAWDYLESLPHREQRFPLTVSTRSAFNLLCGRSALSIPLGELKPESNEWTRLDLNNKDGNDQYPVTIIAGFSIAELEKQLNQIPFPQSDYYPVRNTLINGGIAAVTLDSEQKLLIEANPERRTLNLYTPDKKHIPANLRFDPDWQPQVQESPNTMQQEIKKTPTATWYKINKPVKKNKGKGL